MIETTISLGIILLAYAVGVFIARFAHQEVRDGRMFLEAASASLIASALLLFFSQTPLLALACAVIGFFAHLFSRNKTWLVLRTLAVLLVLFIPETLFPIVSAFFVLYALVAGSLHWLAFSLQRRH